MLLHVSIGQTILRHLKYITLSPQNIIYIYITTGSRVLLEKLTVSQLVQKFPAFYGTRKFITVFIRVRHLSLSWTSSIQSIPPTSWIFILTLSSHLRLGIPSVLSLRFPHQNPVCIPPLPIRATCPAHLTLLDLITRKIFCEECSSSLCSRLHLPVTSSLLGPNILLNTLFSNTLSLPSFFNVSGQVSHPYKTAGKIVYYFANGRYVECLSLTYATDKSKA